MAIQKLSEYVKQSSSNNTKKSSNSSIGTLSDYIKNNNIDIHKSVSDDDIISNTWTNKQKKNYSNYLKKKEKQENSWTNKLVKSSEAFDDGYQFGDVTKTIGSTVGTLASDIGKGFFSSVEGVADAAQYGLSDLASGLSNVKALDVIDTNARDWLKDKSKWLKNNAKFNSTGAIFGTNENEEDNFVKGWSDDLKENSVAGSLTDSIAEGVGNVAAMAGSGYLAGGLIKGASGLGGTSALANALTKTKQVQTLGSALTSFTSAYGNARSQAYENGASDYEARTNATISGLSEAISEQVFDGLPGMKVEGWGSNLTSKIGEGIKKYFGTSTGKIAMKALDASGEGFEEIISNVLNATGNDIAKIVSDKLGKNYNYGTEDLTGNVGKDVLNQLTSADSWEAFASAALTSALISGGNTYLSESQKNSVLKSYAKENNITLDEAKTMFNNVLQNNVAQNTDSNANFKDRVENEEAESKQLVNNIKSGVSLQGLNDQINNQEVNLPTSTNTTTKGMSFEDSAKNYGLKTNSEEFQTINNLLTKRGIEARFDSTKFDNDQTPSFWNKTVDENGNVKREVIYNPNADEKTVIQNSTIHELLHDVIDSKDGDSIKKSLIEHIKNMEGYDEARQGLINSYMKLTDTDGNQLYNPESKLFNDLMDEEVVASVLGTKLGNQEFIDNLVVSKPSIAKKFYNWVVDKLNKITGGKIEKLYWTDIKNKFETAYNSEYKDSETIDKKYMTIGKKGAENLFYNNKKSRRYRNLAAAQETAEEIHNMSDGSLEEKNVESKKSTGWFKTKYGDWATIISDKDSEIITPLSKNSDYKLKDILKHDLLYEAYPSLANLEVKTEKFTGDSSEANAYYSPKENMIVFNDSKLDTLNTKLTLLHEINHYIENKENFDKNSRGASTKNKTYDEYANNLGEIISNETRVNSDLSQDQLDKIKLPEQAKQTPNYENFYDELVKTYDKDYNIKQKRGIYDYESNSYVKGKNEEVEETQKTNEDNENERYDNRLDDRYYEQELDNSSFDLPLEQRTSGDELLNAQDLIDEVKSVGADVDENGYITLYHQTTDENANKIIQSGEMIAKEPYVFFSTSKEASQSDGRGTTKLEFKIPAEMLELDDIFSDNADLKISLNGNKTLDVSKYLINNNENTSSEEAKDNKGRKLSKEQQTYFENSKLRDENGNLQVYYNGGGDYTTFDNQYMSDQSKWGKGIYLSKYEEVSKKYGTDVKEVYVNITNPINQNEKTISFEQYNNLFNAIYDEDAYIEDYDMYDNDLDLLWDVVNKGNWADYADELKKYTGKDGLIVNDENIAEDMIIAFQSNQIKNVDNTNPTTNEDIRYATQSNEWEDFLSKNFSNNGTKTTFGELRTNLPTVENINANADTDKDRELLNNLPFDLEDNNTITTEERKTLGQKVIENKLNKTMQNQGYKAVNYATKIGKSYLEFDRNQKIEFKDSLSKYIGKTREDLVNAQTYEEVKDLVKKYADKEINYVDETIKDIKTQIRGYNIKIDDSLKNQITDYNDFRKANFGKLTLSNSGQSVDSIYQELCENYPGYFDYNIHTSEDQLYAISDFMNQDTTITEKYRLDDKTINEATEKVYNSLMKNTMSQQELNELQAYLEDKQQARTRQVVRDELLQDMGITVEDIAVGNDISALDIARTDPVRLNEKIFGYEVGKKINDATVNRTKHNEAERTRFLNKERDEISELGIKARSKESAAVQKYGEKKYVNEYGEEVSYGQRELEAEFSDLETQEKIKKAAQVIRDKYDSYIDMINNSIVDMGYEPIKKRADYMRHFTELSDALSKFGFPINKESLNENNIPTDINGLTDQFKPGKNWFASALQRKGINTTYDAITGIDGYLEGASNLIYHTEDIQRYRAFSQLIRDTYGQSKGFDELGGMTEEDRNQRIDDVYSNKLSKYAAWVDEQANALAGKKSKLDRGAEDFMGRRLYSILDAAKKQVGSNMTGFNVRSALTNFASVVQGASKTNKLAFIKGLDSTVQNYIHHDDLVDKSDFLTSRFGSNQLSQKLWGKLSNAGQILMSGTDYFSSNVIWRSKYYENLSNNMSEEDAIKDADDFSARIMGDRSKGATAALFNSKTLGILTQFQLEVNNQWSSMIHDNKMDIQSGKKTGTAVLFQLGELAAGSYLFNNLMESLTGSSVMFDPIEILKTIIGSGDDDDDEKTTEEKAKSVFSEIFNNLPFASFLTGGRLPISEAFTGLSTAASYITGGTDSYGNDITMEDVKDDVISSAFYWLLPTGYSQIKKTTKGLSMYDSNLPIAGSYTDSGNLRFEADTTPTGVIKAALFGQYSSKNAQDYINSGYKTTSKEQLETIKESGLSVKEYNEYKSGISEAKKEAKENGTSQSSAVYDYIINLPLDDDVKNTLINNALNKKDEFTDKNGYVKYKDSNGKSYWYDSTNGRLYDTDYDEIEDFDIRKLTKYSNTIDVSNSEDYGSYDEFIYSNQNPEKYSVITQITDYNTYKEYEKAIEDIQDQYETNDNMTSKQKTAVSNARKKAVQQYIQSLPLTKWQKIMLEKEGAGYSVSDYKSELRSYIQSLSLTKDEKEALDKELLG